MDLSKLGSFVQWLNLNLVVKRKETLRVHVFQGSRDGFTLHNG